MVLLVAHTPVFGVKVYCVVAILFNAGDHVPLIKLVETKGNAANEAPEQIGDTCVNAGVTSGFTVMVIVVLVAHTPVFGVNVYCVVAVLFNAGDHVPLIKLVEASGNAANEAPEQIGATCVNVGVTKGFTVMVIVVLVAHSPVFGVNVYCVVAVLFNAGDHVPLIKLVEASGNAANETPEQIGATCVNVGVTNGFTVIVMIVLVAHSLVFGVNVYCVVVVLFNAGDHVPLIKLVEVSGNAANVVPEQIGATCVNVGVTNGFTVIVMMVLVAHTPVFGVNVYCVVAVLFNAGDHVPLIKLVETKGNAANEAPEQIGAT